jgi:hypothetical protein
MYKTHGRVSTNACVSDEGYSPVCFEPATKMGLGMSGAGRKAFLVCY